MTTTGIDTVLIRDLRLSTKARNCLRRAEITTAAELVTWTEYELLRDVHGLGRAALAEITDALAKWGWALRKQARRDGLAKEARQAAKAQRAAAAAAAAVPVPRIPDFVDGTFEAAGDRTRAGA